MRKPGKEAAELPPFSLSSAGEGALETEIQARRRRNQRDKPKMSYQPPGFPVKTLPFWVGLAHAPQGNARFLRRLHTLVDGDGERAWNGGPRLWTQAGLRADAAGRLAAWHRSADLDRIQESLRLHGIDPWWFTAHDFPARLQEIPDPPAILFRRGGSAVFSEPAVAIVGTRSPTRYGLDAAALLARGCAAAGIAVVSGLALGIDGHAHASALDAGGAGIAVLGSGIDEPTLHPARHRALARRLCEAGAICSEAPPGAPGEPYRFPQRNRLIAGLAQAVVVVEAADGSGSLITANLAAEQGRDVLAVPGPITSDLARGVNRLLADGAIPCRGPEDILAALRMDTGLARRDAASVEAMPTDTMDRRLLEALRNTRSIDELGEGLCIPVPELQSRLGRMEVAGWVERRSSRAFVRVAGLRIAPGDRD
jgi:DNA processing protein